MRPGLPLPLQRRNGLAAVIDLQVVPRAIVRGGENGLEVEGDVLVLGLEGNPDRRQLLGQPDRPERGPGPLFARETWTRYSCSGIPP